MDSAKLRLHSYTVVSHDHGVAWVSGSHILPRHSPPCRQRNATFENRPVKNQATPSSSSRSQRPEKASGRIAGRTRPLQQGGVAGGSNVATASATLVAPSADTFGELLDSANAVAIELNFMSQRDQGQGKAALSQDEASVALETLYRMQTSVHVSEPPLSPYSAVFGKEGLRDDFLMDGEGRKTSDRGEKETLSAVSSHETVALVEERILQTKARKRSWRSKVGGSGEEMGSGDVAAGESFQQESTNQTETPVSERKKRSRRKVKLDSVADVAVDRLGAAGNSEEESETQNGDEDGGVVGETVAEVPRSESGFDSGLKEKTTDIRSGSSDCERQSESKAKDGMNVEHRADNEGDEVLISFGDTKKLHGKRQRRLSLNSRIQLRREQVEGQQSVLKRRVIQKWAGIRLPPAAGPMPAEDLEEFVRQNGRLRSPKPGWGWQKRSPLLTAAEEVQLGNLMQAFKPAQQTRLVLEADLGRPPTDEEWARACSVSLQVLKRQMEVHDAARNKLLTSNLGFIFQLANKYSSMQSKLTIPELEQLGVEGLLKGVERWDPNRNIRFSTYVGFWIRTFMLRPIGKYGYLLRGPARIQELHRTQRKARQELTVLFGRPPNIQELATRQNISTAKCRQIMRLCSQGLSLNRADRVTGQELISQLRAEEDVGRDFRKPAVRFLLDDVLDTLKPRESLVIRQRFGFDGKAGQTLREIGRNLGVTYECARLWEAQGLRKMRHSARVEYLRENVLEL